LEARVRARFTINHVSGTQRRKKKHVAVQNVNEDKKLKSAIKKFGKAQNVGSFWLRCAASVRHRGGEYVQG
jgi:hypothetical protein